MRVTGIIHAASLVIVALLAGCSSGGPNAEPAPTNTEPVGPDVGAIVGKILDPELKPVPGAQVAITSGLNEPQVSDAMGAFHFTNVQPGPQTFYVAAIGYQAVARSVDVTAGETTDVTITLAPIDSTEPYQALEIHKGFIACGSGVGVEGSGVTQVSCGASDENQVFLFTYPFGADLSGILIEMTWTPSQALSRDLVINVEKEGCDVTCEADDTFAQVQGCCYLRIPITIDELSLPDGVKPATDFSEGGVIQSRTFPAFGEMGAPVTLFAGQEFFVYVEYAYRALPSDWETRSNIPE